MSCCAKCKNPFIGCANQGCRCHGWKAPVVTLPARSSQEDLRHADRLNDARNPHIE